MPAISAVPRVTGTIGAVPTLRGSISVESGYAAYGGPYEVTPTATAQTFPTTGKLMVREFTVNPIPSNWGLITWNGLTLTVS